MKQALPIRVFCLLAALLFVATAYDVKVSPSHYGSAAYNDFERFATSSPSNTKWNFPFNVKLGYVF